LDQRGDVDEVVRVGDPVSHRMMLQVLYRGGVDTHSNPQPSKNTFWACKARIRVKLPPLKLALTVFATLATELAKLALEVSFEYLVLRPLKLACLQISLFATSQENIRSAQPAPAEENSKGQIRKWDRRFGGWKGAAKRG